MTDPSLYAAIGGGVPTAVGALFLVRKYGRALWRNRAKIEQVVEVFAGDDMKVTTTTKTTDPSDLVPTPAGDTEAILASLVAQQFTDLTARLDRVEAELHDLRTENAELRDRVPALEAEVARLRSENDRLGGVNEHLTARIRELEAELHELRATQSRTDTEGV